VTLDVDLITDLESRGQVDACHYRSGEEGANLADFYFWHF
jgi:hypothetical protein